MFTYIQFLCNALSGNNISIDSTRSRINISFFLENNGEARFSPYLIITTLEIAYQCGLTYEGCGNMFCSTPSPSPS